MHDALELLRKEEADRRRSDAEAARRNRLERMKREMMEANEAQKRFKKAQGVRDMEAEKVLVSKMMAKFKEDEWQLLKDEYEEMNEDLEKSYKALLNNLAHSNRLEANEKKAIIMMDTAFTTNKQHLCTYIGKCRLCFSISFFNSISNIYE